MMHAHPWNPAFLFDTNSTLFFCVIFPFYGLAQPPPFLCVGVHYLSIFALVVFGLGGVKSSFFVSLIFPFLYFIK